MNITTLVRGRILEALRGLERAGVLPAGLELAGVEAVPPRDAVRGDLTSTAALVLAKAAGMPARAIAERLAERLRGDVDFAAVEVAGAGFLNLRFAPRFWHGVLAAILKAGSAYGRSNLGAGERVAVPQPGIGLAGAPTISQARAVALADALARVLDCTGFAVTRIGAAAAGGGALPEGPPVKLLRSGAPVQLTLRELVEEVGEDAVRFTLLSARPDAALSLDLTKVRDPSYANPVFAVQYAHARAKSAFRNALEVFPRFEEGSAAVMGGDLCLLADSGEIELIKRLARFPGLLEETASAREPYRLAVYLYDLASSFHCRMRLGNESPHLRFMQPADGTLTAARLALVQAVAQVLAMGLALLGVLAPMEMR